MEGAMTHSCQQAKQGGMTDRPSMTQEKWTDRMLLKRLRSFNVNTKTSPNAMADRLRVLSMPQVINNIKT